MHDIQNLSAILLRKCVKHTWNGKDLSMQSIPRLNHGFFAFFRFFFIESAAQCYIQNTSQLKSTFTFKMEILARLNHVEESGLFYVCLADKG